MKTQHIQLVGTATVGPKGQVVIPACAREKMHIKPGDRLIALYVEDKQSIAFVTEPQAQSIVDQLGGHVSQLQSALQPRDEASS